MQEATQTVLKCAADGAAATQICAACDRPACDQCVVRYAEGRIVCRACSYRDALQGSVRKIEDDRVAVARAKKARNPRRNARIRRAVSVTILAVALPVLGGVQAPALTEALETPAPFAYGACETEGAPGLAEALGGLWRIRAAMDAYAADHQGQVPASLDDLADAPRVCPGCGAAWSYEHKDGAWSVSCPQPKSHRRSAVLIDSQIGPPQVAMSESQRGE